MIFEHYDQLDDYIERGLIKKTSHPASDMYIYNYTMDCMVWNIRDEVICECRGLILDSDGTVIARPFKKFFNWQEMKVVDRPKGTPKHVFDKVDGSLGIIYHNGHYRDVATRGSMTSTQATVGYELLKDYDISRLEIGTTYLVEIIYPQNRIVLKYPGERKLYYLGSVNNETGKEVFDEALGIFDQIDKYEFSNIETLIKAEIDNKEGYVLLYEGGQKVKVKLKRYVELHRAFSGLSTVSVRLAMKDGYLDDIIGLFDGDALEWVHRKINKLSDDYTNIKTTTKSLFKKVKDLHSRKEQAMGIIKETKHPGIVFAMLDGKDYSEMLWKGIMPEKLFFTSLNVPNEKVDPDALTPVKR